MSTLPWRSVLLASLAVVGGTGCKPAAPAPEASPGAREPTTPLLEKEDVQLELGLRGHHRDGVWSLLRVKVRNRGLAFRGRLEVHGVVNRTAEGAAVLESITYSLPLEVPRGGPARQLWVPVRPQGWIGVQASFEQPGYTRRHELDLGPAPEDHAAVLLVGQKVPSLSRLLAGAERPTGSPPIEDIDILTTVEEELPPLAAGFEAFDLVVLDATGLARADPSAIEALASWVEAGGTLVAFPGPDWTGAMSGRLRALLGVELAPGLALPPGVRSRTGGPDVPGLELPLAPRQGTEEIEPGLAYRSRQGAGSVTAFAFGPTGDELPHAGKAQGLAGPLRSALSRGLAVAADARNLDGAADRARRVLEKLTAFLVPERRAVVSGLALYLALGFFLPAWLFRRLRRPWWTFAWIAAAAISATWVVYRHGLVTARSTAELSEVTYLRPHPDGRTMEATSFIGCFSPGPASIDFWGPDGEAADHPLRDARARVLEEPSRDASGWLAAFLEEEVTYTADRAGRLRLGPVRLRPNVLKLFRVDYRLEVDPGLFAGDAATTAREATDNLGAGVPPGLTVRHRVRVTRGSVFPGAPEITVRKGVLVLLEERPGEAEER